MRSPPPPNLESPGRPAAGAETRPLLLLHLAAYAVAAVAAWHATTLLAGEQMAAYVALAIALGGMVNYLLWRWQRWLRWLGLLGVLAVVGACHYLKVKQNPPVIDVLEWLLLGLLLAQALCASRPRHYAALLLLTICLGFVVVRHLGAAPAHIVWPIVALSLLAACFLQGSASPEVHPGARTRRAIPLPALLVRTLVLAVAAILGGLYVARHLPALKTDRYTAGFQLWVTYVRSTLGLQSDTIVTNPLPPERLEREAEWLLRHLPEAPLQLNLTRTSPQRLSARLLFIVDSQRPVYLRGTVLDYYTGLAWGHSRPIALTPLSTGERIPPQIGIPDRLNFGGKPSPGRELCRIWPQADVGFVLPVPVTGRQLLRGNLERLYRDQLNNLYSQTPIGRGMRYEAYLGNVEMAALADLPIGNDEVELAEQYLQLPAVSQELITACQEAVDGELRRLPAVMRLTELVQRDKRYSLKPVVLPPEVTESTEYFLFHMKEGACTQYASALTVACRIVGIPARVAMGYGPGTHQPSTMLYEVRERDAHAWTQVWFPNHGWVDVDATPGGIDLAEEPPPPPEIEQRATLDDVIAAVKRGWRAGRQQATALLASSWQWAMARRYWPVYALLAVLHAVILWFAGRYLLVRLRWWYRWHRAPRRPIRQGIEDSYRCLLETIRRFGVAIEPSQTPTEIARDVRTRNYPWADELAAITETAERHLFGRAEPTAEACQALRQRIAALCGSLKPPPPPPKAKPGTQIS